MLYRFVIDVDTDDPQATEEKVSEFPTLIANFIEAVCFANADLSYNLADRLDLVRFVHLHDGENLCHPCYELYDDGRS